MYIFTLSDEEITYHYYLGQECYINDISIKGTLVESDSIVNLCFCDSVEILNKLRNYTYKDKEVKEHLKIINSSDVFYKKRKYYHQIFREFINTHQDKVKKSLLLL